ncbi:MAG: TusE/DsrC/DsvC family sulfur relay protein [Pseudomonadota bacterium]|nr:TusE/DsrC/DsvC family sulfur relay protein [Pseudomonadota bacterium]
MAYEVDGKLIETDDNGYLLNLEDWDESVAQVIATQEGIEALTPRHWDVINYLREEYLNNAGNQPNMRTLTKSMQDTWQDKSVDTKILYELFPLGPAKQAAKIGGLPESKRKGGY